MFCVLSYHCMVCDMSDFLLNEYEWMNECLSSLALCAYEISCSKIFDWFHMHRELAFDNKVLKTLVEFRICWKCSKFERCWIQIRDKVQIRIWQRSNFEIQQMFEHGRIRIRTSSHLYLEL